MSQTKWLVSRISRCGPDFFSVPLQPWIKCLGNFLNVSRIAINIEGGEGGCMIDGLYFTPF